MIWLIPIIRRGDKLVFRKLPRGKLSAQSKLKKPNISNCFIVDNIAVGVEMNRIMTRVKMCKISLLKIKTPLFEPPKFFQRISIGSLAIFIRRICSSITPYC